MEKSQKIEGYCRNQQSIFVKGGKATYQTLILEV